MTATTTIDIPVQRRSTVDRVARLWEQAEQAMERRNPGAALLFLQMILNEPQAEEEEAAHA